MKEEIRETIIEILKNNYIEDSPDLILELFDQEKEKLIHDHEILVNTILEEKNWEKIEMLKRLIKNIEPWVEKPNRENGEKIYKIKSTIIKEVWLKQKAVLQKEIEEIGKKSLQKKGQIQNTKDGQGGNLIFLANQNGPKMVI